MLTLNDLQIGYGRKTLATLPPLKVQPGEFICLLGRNGQGKSTLLRTLAGFIPAVAGQAVLDGRPIADWRGAERARKIGVVLTDRPQVGALGVIELVELGRQPYTGWSGALTEDDHRIAADALIQVGGAHLADRTVDSLSDGERQRVMIARALTQSPDLMLLDEITAFLDLPSRVTIVSTLRRIAQETGVAIILSSHDLELSLHAADRLWLLPGEGRFVDGAPEDVALSGAIGQAFDQDNLVFSLESGRFETPDGHGRTVFVDGDGPRAVWTERALSRLGWRTTDGSASADLVITLDPTSDDWLRTPQGAFASIADLLSSLHP